MSSDSNMRSIEETSVDEKLFVLSAWWTRHCKEFSIWFLSLNSSQQEILIKSIVPDMKASKPADLNSQPTDIILPEFTLEGLLASKGRLLILFMTRRLTSPELFSSQIGDIKYINTLFDTNKLPNFTGNTLNGMDTPFVDPVDSDENIRSLSPLTSPDARKTILEHLKTGRLVRAEVWIAVKLRRASICALLEGMAEAHYQAAETKPSPSYRSLLKGEIEQQESLLDKEERMKGEVDC